MLTIDVNKRSKIKDLLNHPWFESDITSPRTSDTATPRDVTALYDLICSYTILLNLYGIRHAPYSAYA